MERINLSSIKKESVRAIFTAITGKDQISRSEIADITGLSLMTVGKVVDALLERHVIIQSKEVKNIAGRRAGLVSLNTEKFFMIIDLTSRNMSMTVMDIALNIVDKITYEYNSDFYYEENLYIFMKNVKIYILRKLNMDDAAGIGVVLPGTYSAAADTVDTTRIPELAKTHVRAIIEDVLKNNLTTNVSKTASSAEDAASASLVGKPRMGVTVANINQNYSLVVQGLIPRGVLIQEVEAFSPAEKAGIRAGDIIVDINDTVITNYTQMNEIIASKKAGDTLQVKVYRAEGMLDLLDGESITEQDVPEGEYVDLEVVLAIVDEVKQ